MTNDAGASIEPTPEELLVGLAGGNSDVFKLAMAMQAENLEESGLDARTYSLVKLATLVALDAPGVSYLLQTALALDNGVTPSDLVGLLVAVGPQLGQPRIVAGARNIALALGISEEVAAD